MNDTPNQTIKKRCTVEIYSASAPGAVDVSYYLRRKAIPTVNPDPDPITIISWNEDYEVVVDVAFKDRAAESYCGSLCVAVDIDSCGITPDSQLPQEILELDPAGNTTNFAYQVVVQVPGTVFQPKEGWPERCVRSFTLCVSVGSLTTKGNPGGLWAQCDPLQVLVHPPVAA